MSALDAGEPAQLEGAMLRALDGLVRALDLDRVADGRFRAPGEPERFGRIFGGQMLAQAVMAASATVTGAGKAPSSLHAYFTAAGRPADPVELVVDRVRDGRSMATRRVDLGQDGRVLLTAIVSFHAGPGPDPGSGAPELADGSADRGGPAGLPTLQDWVAEVPEHLRPSARTWVDRPPPIEMRIGEPPVFLGGAQTTGPRSHWMRPAGPVSDDPALQAALLAYASDFLLLDMAFRSHPVPFGSGRLAGTSLDHAIWFHRPVRFDRWHRHTQQTAALSGERGLVHGSIHDDKGHLVASTAQEVLVRVSTPPT